MAVIIKKIVAYVGVFLMSCLLLAGIGINYYFDKAYKKTVELKVLKAPPSIRTFPQAPYAGAHPAHLKRQDDAFPYPILPGESGPVESLYAGSLQYPFLCETESSGLGQPIVDNQQGYGIPVYRNIASGKKMHDIVGYSKDCSLPTRITYYYVKKDKLSVNLYSTNVPSDEIAKIQINGKEQDFIVRLETGTIDRFIYAIAILKGDEDTVLKADTTLWNKKLVYHFGGGVGIGKKQGKLNQWDFIEKMIEPLSSGYAVAFSTGNQTSTHYNMWLAEEVMLRVKNQFSAAYGKPQYTVGLGGSGGAIQQLLIAQNHPGLLDAAFLLYSYPDMLSQTIYAYDCELLEYYFDTQAAHSDRWNEYENRELIEGLNVIKGFKNRFFYYYSLARTMNGLWPPSVPGMSECSHAWRGLTQLTNNPYFTHHAASYSKEVMEGSHWTHWDDLVDVYGLDQNGFANVAWDNVGVQYGLHALQTGKITTEEFIHLNANIGGWKTPEDYQQEKFWKITEGTGLFEISPWGHHNMLLSQDSGMTPAKRTEANPDTIRAAYLSGHVFLGKLDIPTIDLRHYMEDDLDMHHLSASFSMRSRIMSAMGYTDHHVLWVTHKPHLPVKEGLLALDEWLENSKRYPELSISLTKPVELMDRCYSEKGVVLAEGANVWDGAWNDKAQGTCLKIYPNYTDSRLIAGAPWTGDTFKCQLKPVDAAIEEGLYADVDMKPYHDVLNKIFPSGVCDYSRPSLGVIEASEIFPHSKTRYASGDAD